MARVCEFSVVDLSPHNCDDVEEMFVLIKGYIDGGNNPNDPSHRFVTVSAICGTKDHIQGFSREWKQTFGTRCLHTTDAVRNGEHDFLSSAVDLISKHVIKDDLFRGLIPTTVIVNTHDFRRVRDESPDAPRVLSEVMAAQLLDQIFFCGREVAQADGWDHRKIFYNLFFDRNEPYRGHLEDRKRSPLFVRTVMERNCIDLPRYLLIGDELDSAYFPELQAADMFSWCYSRRSNVKFEWQYRLLDEVWAHGTLLDYPALSKPLRETVDFIKSCNLPLRAVR